MNWLRTHHLGVRPQKWKTHVLGRGLLPAALFAVQVAAQVSPPASGPVVLSPFSVDSDRDKGFAATETLSGTRLRTDLRDIGASLTIITPQFMQDLAVNSFEQALLYTPSVEAYEGDNADVNRAGGNQVRQSTGQNYTIRGFNTNYGEQSVSHDFFSALDPTDNYNVERTTLSLGPNALLIGVGNPQGTAVTSTKRAQLQRRRTEVQLQADRWRSGRIAIDHNQPLVKDRLAVRFNLLHDQKREFRRYEGRNQERMTLGVTARPFPNTTITLNHENYTIHSNLASLTWGFDAAAIQWVAAGRPSVQFLPAGQQWTATRAYVDASGNRVRVAPGVVDEDGFVDARTDFDPRLVLNQNTAQQQRWIVGLGLPNPMVNLRYQAGMTAATFGGIGSNVYQSKDPWEWLGLRRDTNLNGGTWDDPSQKQHGRWSVLLLEQKLATGLFLEVGANVATQHRFADTSNFTVVQIDPNRYLPDGSPNPGYLVPFDDNGQMQKRYFDNRTNEYRATLSYELDVARVHRWLGRHSFSVLWQLGRSEASTDLTRVFNTATVGLGGNGWSNDAVNATNLIGTRVYFLNGNVPTMPDSTQVEKNRSVIEGYGRLLGATANESAPIKLSRQSFLNAIKSKFFENTLSGGWQGRWFDGRVVTVAGLRKNATESYDIPTVRDVVLPTIPGAAADPLKQYYTPAREIAFNRVPSASADGLSRTVGVVAHALPWLSLTYSRSSNFLPVTNASLLNALGEAAPNSKGRTDDYGIRFSFLGGRLAAGVSHFKTFADNQARNANNNVGGARNILARLRNNYKVAGDSHFRELAEVNFYPVDTGNVADTWSYLSEGYEMNLVFNPSRNWRLALSGSSNTNTLGTHLQALGTYLYTDTKFQGLGTWRTFAAELDRVAGGQRSTYFDLDPSNATARAQASADALYIRQQADAQERSWRDDQSLTGITTGRNGKYAFNGLVTRVFTEGRLRGWSVGGNFRWRGAGTLGYERFPEATGAFTGRFDVTRPIKGSDFWDLGAMTSYEHRVFSNIAWRIQLNVQNLPNWQQSRLVKSDYDTNGVYGPTTAIVPVMWEMRRPRNFVLTSTFTF